MIEEHAEDAPLQQEPWAVGVSDSLAEAWPAGRSDGELEGDQLLSKGSAGNPLRTGERLSFAQWS